MASSEKPVPVRVKGQSTCVHHHRKKLNFFCTFCGELACTKCRSSIHAGHNISDLNDIIPDRKTKLQVFVDEFEKNKIAIRKEKTTANKELEERSEMFTKLIRKIETQGEIIKKETDKLTSKYTHLYKQLQEDNVTMMNTYTKGLQNRLGNLKSHYKETKTLLQEDVSDVLIFDIENEIQNNFKNPPVKPTLHTVSSFKVNRYPQADLEKVFGLSEETEHQHHHLTSTDLNDQNIQDSSDLDLKPYTDIFKIYPSPSSDDIFDLGQSTIQPESVNISPFLQYDLLLQCEVVTEFECPCEVSSICPSPGGEVWVCDVLSNTISLLDHTGQVRNSVEYQKGITDISMSPNTNAVWTCSDEDCSITEYCLLPGKSVLSFHTKVKPSCLCVTEDEHIIVGMSNEITKFKKDGEVVLTTKSSISGVPLVYTPYRITECRITGNLAVVDWNLVEDGGEDKGCVLIMDKHFNEILHYKGDMQLQQQGETITTTRFPFSPTGARYDSVGNLVIGDCLNGCLHLINSRGQFLQLLYMGPMDIWAFGIESDNTLWAVFGQPEGRTHVKILQYARSTAID